jgi:Flp pilus assembly protein TadD
MGDSDTAWNVIQEEPLEWMRVCGSAVILHKLGRDSEAENAVARLIEMGLEETNYIQQADVYAQMGDHEQAITSLNQAVELRDPGLTQLLVDPFLDPIRDDPRFKEIYAGLGFEQV